VGRFSIGFNDVMRVGVATSHAAVDVHGAIHDGLLLLTRGSSPHHCVASGHSARGELADHRVSARYCRDLGANGSITYAAQNLAGVQRSHKWPDGDPMNSGGRPALLVWERLWGGCCRVPFSGDAHPSETLRLSAGPCKVTDGFPSGRNYAQGLLFPGGCGVVGTGIEGQLTIGLSSATLPRQLPSIRRRHRYMPFIAVSPISTSNALGFTYMAKGIALAGTRTGSIGH
jgi:hypothetical protein